MNNPFDKDIVILNAPSKICLNVGDIQGEVEFNALNHVQWSVTPLNEYDLEYIHTRFYKKERTTARMFKNAFFSLKEAQREYRDYYKIASKHIEMIHSMIDTGSLSTDQHDKIISSILELKMITEIIEEYQED